MKIHQEGITHFDKPIELKALFSMDESLFDYDYPIHLNNLNVDNEISTLNYKILVKAVESFGGDVERLFELYQRHQPDIMTHAKRFISNRDAVFFHDCARRVLAERGVVFEGGTAFNPRFHLNLGQFGGKHQSLGRTLDFLAQFVPMKKIYRESVKYGRFFNNTELYKCVYNEGNVAVIIHKYFEKYRDQYRFTQNNWARGIFAGIPAARGLRPSVSTIDYCLYTIFEVLEKDFDYLGLDQRLFSTSVDQVNSLGRKRYYYKDKEFAYEAILEKTVISREKKRIDGKRVWYDHEVYDTVPREFEDFREREIREGLENRQITKIELITSDLIMGTELLFKKSEMFGAPYTRFTFKYPSQSGLRNVAGKVMRPAKILFSYQNMIDRELAATREEAVRAAKEAQVARENEGLAKKEQAKAEEALRAVQEKTEQVKEISKELRKERDNLEIRVGERTSELADALEKLRELDKLKSNFFANISHEIRTPLTLILSPIESVLQGDYGKRIDERFFENLHRNAIRLLDLINSILDFSKIEAVRMSMKVRSVDIVKLVASYVGSVRSACESRAISISFDHSCEYANAYVDTEKIDKVLMNLFSNALKFTEKDGQLLIRVKEDEKHCLIEFEDTGMGIPADKMPSIFDRFSQVDSESTRKHEGTGIGLALAKELVEMHGGAISVQSKFAGDHPEDHGTIFTVALPQGKQHFDEMENIRIIPDTVADAAISDQLFSDRIRIHHLVATEVETDSLTESTPVHLPGRPTILIVEDNRDMQGFLRSLLEQRHTIFAAENGLEGIDSARKLSPDLIVTDVMMPVMNGYEMTRRIKADEELRHIPIIMLTAKSEIVNKIEGLEYGADDYLTKPFNSKELLTRIKSLLTIKARTEELHEAQARLAEAEKRSLEHCITGGFAHEMRKEYGQHFQDDFERIGIAYRVEGVEKAEVKADETHMNSIFSNLILNARDALEEQIRERKVINVLIETSEEEGKRELKIEVSDNGPGVPEEHLHEIFEPFFSTKPTTGTGLGLGIVKRLVELYDGEIEVASNQGVGTTFTVVLPSNM